MKKLTSLFAVLLVFTLLPFALAEGNATNSSVAVCSDSDLGVDYYLKGHMTDPAHNADYTDTCTTLQTTDASGGWKPTSEGTVLAEYYCGDTNYKYTFYKCENGCSDGACLKSKPAVVTCKDSDGGLNYFVRGQTNVQNSDSTSANTGFDDVCLNSITLSEGYCENNQLMTQKIDCKAGCSEGVCVSSTCGGIAGIQCQAGYYCKFGDETYPSTDRSGVCIKQEETIQEQVTCIFKGSNSDQQCYTGEIQTGCKGTDTCTTPVSTEKGKKLTWKSSCGGYQYTVQDGADETIVFECSPAGQINETKIAANAFRKAYWQCYDGKESFEGGESSCKPYGLWKKYASDFCQARCSSGKEKCGVSSFSLSTPCYSDLPQKEVPVVVGASSTDCEDYAQECKNGNQAMCDKWQTNCQVSEPTSVPILNICKDSCPSDDKCYPFGYRKAETFCSDSGAFVQQLESNGKCDNNFECGSNVCVNNQCISPGLMEQIINWFKRLFGSK